MIDYSNIPHPLLSDSGTCQSERFPSMLNPESVKIDDQSIEDILQFINKYARFVNFYEAKQINNSRFEENHELHISNWQDFFSKSLPFQLAALVKKDVQELEANMDNILALIDEAPLADNIQLLIDFIFSELILVFDESLSNVNAAGSSFSTVLKRMMTSGLRASVMEFIAITKQLVNDLGLKGIAFSSRLQFDNWDIPNSNTIAPTNYSTLQEMLDQLKGHANVFMRELRNLAQKTSDYLPQALYPAKEDEQGRISPHVGLLLAFLQLKKKFTLNLNDLTRRHLLHFYNDVLQIKGRPAVPDETFVVFQLQKQVNNPYLLRKGTRVKDGKDDNKADIIFELEKDVVLDKAQIKEIRTLYLNPVYGLLEENTTRACTDTALDKLTEGLYIAPQANTMDGVEEAFKDDPKNWATLGAKESKLIEEGTPKLHPPARMGFVLASPVLYLQEGGRKINIQICCKKGSEANNINQELFEKIGGYFDTSIENLLKARKILAEQYTADDITIFENFLRQICPKNVKIKLDDENEDCERYIDAESAQIIQEALGLGDNVDFNYDLLTLVDLLFKNEDLVPVGGFLFSIFDCPEQIPISPSQNQGNFPGLLLLKNLLFVQPFNLWFSGEKGWEKVPSEAIEFDLFQSTDPDVCSPDADVQLSFLVDLKNDFPAITFADEEVLEEPIGSTHPALKIELDPDYKLICDTFEYQPCCSLKHCHPKGKVNISAYHLLKHLEILDTCIDVEVCGVKNLIVQNDEALQDVNNPIYPFGTRPEIIDFNRNLDLKNTLENPMPSTLPNLIGPNFFIGNKEILCKDWQDLWVNINWKDRPSDFQEYYKAYVARPRRNPDGSPVFDSEGFPVYDSFGLIENDFEINVSLLDEGNWKREGLVVDRTKERFLPWQPAGTGAFTERPNPFTGHNNRELFKSNDHAAFCIDYHSNDQGDFIYEQTLQVTRTDFSGTPSFKNLNKEQEALTVSTRNGFLRFNLQNQDFFHRDYAEALAIQMMAFAKLPDEVVVEAIYIDKASNSVIKFNDLATAVSSFQNNITTLVNHADDPVNQVSTILQPDLTNVLNRANDALDELNNIDVAAIVTNDEGASETNVTNAIDDVRTELNQLITAINTTIDHVELAGDDDDLASEVQEVLDAANALQTSYAAVQKFFEIFNILPGGDIRVGLEAPIPSEPWTPVIKDISIDYTAKATETDIELIHLYPFENTYKKEDISANPNLLPVFTDEGTLYLALENITKGNTLNLLFHLAEATANTEMNKPAISWAYLTGNDWQPLRPGFSVLDDGTDGLTKSGIVEISIPTDISKTGHTIMPPEQYWIKASAEENSKAVCETIGIYTQAAKVIAQLSPENDPKRLEEALPAEQINRLNEADSSIKKVLQPIASFYGKPPESDSPNRLYRRISERLRHKDRAITGFDYERITLESFPQVFKAKTINHTFGLPATEYIRDLEVAAPGFVTLAVIPDIHQLDIGGALEPRIPLSQLEQIREHLITRHSPFVRLKVMNPRYEKVNVAIKVRFQEGNSGPYFQDLLANDIKAFLAPWLLGKTDRLEFGAALSKSDLIAFVEQLYYIDYICQIDWVHEFDLEDGCLPKAISCCIYPKESREFIAPLTARSILTAGEIKVCELDRLCETYDPKVECKEDVKIL